jgi:polar amino acid transport system substrate-binding protein
MRASNRVILLSVFLNFLNVGVSYAEKIRCVSSPLIYADPETKKTVFAAEIVEKALKALGHTLELEVFPFQRAYDMVKDGQKDCYFTLYVSPEREQYFDFSREIVAPQAVFFYANKKSKLKFDGDLQSVKDRTIGVMSTMSYGKRFDDIKASLKLSPVPAVPQNFRKLALGRVDLVISNITTASSVLKSIPKEEAAQIERLSPAVEELPSYVAFSKKRNLGALRDQFDKQIRKMIASGEYRKIVSSSIPPEVLNVLLKKP